MHLHSRCPSSVVKSAVVGGLRIDFLSYPADSFDVVSAVFGVMIVDIASTVYYCAEAGSKDEKLGNEVVIEHVQKFKYVMDDREYLFWIFPFVG